MEKLINPVPKAISKSTSNKVITYQVTPNLDVVAPYDGKITIMGNNVRIKHKINDKVYYSDIENIVNINFSLQNIKQGQKIGETGNSDITYIILDENKKKVDINDVFTKESDKGFEKDKSTSLDILRTFTLPLSIPSDFIKSAGKNVKSAGKYAFDRLIGREVSESMGENKINEEVERIKKLMK